MFAKDLFDARDSNGRQLVPSSGLVIAGFGTDELYPCLIGYDLEGVVDGLVKYREGVERKVGTDMSATLVPFAQREMVHGFMDGVTPEYKEALFVALKELFDKYPDKVAQSLGRISKKRKTDIVSKLKIDGQELIELFWESLNDWVKTTNADPILDTIEVLPIAELASMAESLVNLTSFKRRVTLKVPETVGGPIDVAVISKGDGFVWINRKHYFEAKTNPHFFKNYYR